MAKKIRDSEHTPAGEAATELLRAVFLFDAVLIARGDEMTADLGLTSARWQLLAAASGSPKSVPQLARRMSLSRQSVQRLVDLLAKSGFVRLIDNPDHVRAKLVEVTDKGVRGRAELRERQVAWVNEVTKAMTQNELDAARDVLTRLQAAIVQEWGRDTD